MAYSARHKRQTRFYWAELGFMALGLFGLQPSLFTSLFKGSRSRTSSLADAAYATQPGQQSTLGYAYLPSQQQFASYLHAYPEFSPSQASAWQQQTGAQVAYTPQQVSYLNQPFATTQPYATNQPAAVPQSYAATQAYNTTQQPYGGLQQPYSGSQSYYPQTDYSLQNRNSNSTAASTYSNLYGATPSKYQQLDFQPAQPSRANGSQNSTNYLAQANAGYGASGYRPEGYGLSGYGPSSPAIPTAVPFNNWSASQPNLYGGGQNSDSSAYNTFAPSSSLQRYRAPSPLYR